MKKIAKLLLFVLLFGTIAVLAVSLAACNGGNKFVIYNCADYIDEEILSEFEDYYKEKTGQKIKVVYSTFDTNEEMLTKMDSGAAVDVICPSEYAIQRLIEKGYVQKINKENISTIGNVNQDLYNTTKRVFSALDTEAKNINDYYVPYMWGTVGIVYNEQTVTNADLANDWGLLWNEAGNSALTKQIYLKDSIRDTYLTAVLYLKHAGALPAKYSEYTTQQLINCTDDEMISAVEAALKTQKSQLKNYEVDNGKEDLAKGSGEVCLCWSGDAFYAIDLAEELGTNGVTLAYYEPEFTNLFIDGWVVSSGCTNVTAAELFIEFLCRPDTAMKNAMYIGYTSGVSQAAIRESAEAKAIIEENGYNVEEYLSDPYIFPDASASKYGIMMDFGSRESSVVTMWQRVKAAKA